MKLSSGTEMAIYTRASALAWLGASKQLCGPGECGGGLGMGLGAKAGPGQGSALTPIQSQQNQDSFAFGTLVWCTQSSLLQQRAGGTQTQLSSPALHCPKG